MKPGNFILDLLRTYAERGTSARNIMAAAKMFDFTDNLVRVTLSRLVSRGLVENYERGRYRLAHQSDPVADFVEQWRMGDSRRRPWIPGSFLVAVTEKMDERGLWVLQANGFRPVRPGAWCRPDNLARSGEALRSHLFELGLSSSCLLLDSAGMSEADQRDLLQHYDLPALDDTYRQMNEQLLKSAERLDRLPKQSALKESFTLGGEAIQLLAKDPLLPDEWMTPDSRQALWTTMMGYDELGRQIWAGAPGAMPAAMTNYA